MGDQMSLADLIYSTPGFNGKTRGVLRFMRDHVQGLAPGAELTAKGLYIHIVRNGFDVSSTTVERLLKLLVDEKVLRKERNGHYLVAEQFTGPVVAPQVVGSSSAPISRVRACELLNEYPGSSQKWIENKYGIQGFHVGVGVYFESADLARLLGEAVSK